MVEQKPWFEFSADMILRCMCYVSGCVQSRDRGGKVLGGDLFAEIGPMSIIASFKRPTHFSIRRDVETVQKI